MAAPLPGYQVPRYPVIVVDLRADGSAHVNLAGSHLDYPAGSLASTRAAIIAYGAEVAEGMKRPVRMNTTGPDGNWHLAVHPDGTVTDLNPNTTKPRRRRTATSLPATPHAPEQRTLALPAEPVRAGATSSSWKGPGAPHLGSSTMPTATLIFSTGLVYQLRGPVLLGRKPQPSHQAAGYELLTVGDESRTISKSHLSIHWDGGTLRATDQRSANGTIVDRPGNDPVTLTPRAAYLLCEGDVVHVGDVSFTVGEIGADQ